jgi:hypothetical protein
MDEATTFRLLCLALCLAMVASLTAFKLVDAARAVRALRETHRALRRTVIELERSVREMDGRDGPGRKRRPPISPPSARQ